ncbi:hypothetical protein Tco_1543658, partial [Tanacetum coccineum]
IKLHGVPVTAFSEDGLSAIATKLAMIELRAEVELKDNIVAAMPKINVFGHVQEECPKNTGNSEAMNMKKTSQIPKGFPVGQKTGFKPKQVYQPVSKKTTADTSANKKKNVDLPKEVTNPFEVLTSVENDELGTNRGASNLASKATNSSGSSFWNAESSSPRKPLGKVDEDSEDEVDADDNEMASFLAKRDGYGTHSLVEQWKDSHKLDDYEYDPYNDDMYEGQEIPKML